MPHKPDRSPREQAALVGLGANLGAPCSMLERAARGLDGLLHGVRLVAVSRVWHSAPHQPEPLGLPLPECLRPRLPRPLDAGAWYANSVARLACRSDVTPEALFEALSDLEAALGRDRTLERRWGPRFIDIDLLTFGGVTLRTPRLVLPHPRIAARPFVHLPLAEVALEAPEARFSSGRSFPARTTVLF
ncbi:2-amino-4-hydroxy-6-hydroxymethyldihydropteridine pyrophosphokinase [Fundidesulfovibrio magnetotacticus]|uniref:2-amino-4-hydroxy-6-hydroxymethyldihydropteridine pyrophosphokinase n=1 Tax=Fundidesulfovibrio magnetotacticus TaxID=2730080 RepID=A0A6V8M116_9BACT|nr:2-amino-4-hydroxy-6-hydroxymethyldihydropteridine diphosphokinase [Fundidesulfovibrio magnetotacticus]GFK95547.1 2-amino-4-hydroxy-6-hydroxymethyldihydropteridine pyrophosphokinase [Fundidesulfovibrio magnetotacticus]